MYFLLYFEMTLQKVLNNRRNDRWFDFVDTIIVVVIVILLLLYS